MIEDNVPSDRKLGGKKKITTLILSGVIVLVVFVVGIVLISVASSKKEGQCAQNTTSAPTQTRCVFSKEAQRTGLPEFLSRVKVIYYKLHPYNVYEDPDIKTSTIREKYVAYDPTPSVIKKRTDAALDLLKEISSKSIDSDKLKPRERKSLAQVKHYLQHIFGQPYDVNYYAGDWMLGPNLFCWQEICSHGYGVYNGIGLYHKPYNASDVNLIETKLRTHQEGILQYIENMKMGVKSGMVRSVEECKAGLNAIKRRYLNVSLLNETGSTS